MFSVSPARVSRLGNFKSIEAAVFFAALLGLSGCGRDEIKSYRVPKERPSAAVEAPGMTAAAGAHLHWEKPANWQEFPGEGLRLARFEISGTDGTKADGALLDLQGMEGNELEILNLWRGEIGLDPVGEAELSKLEKVPVGSAQALLIDLKNEEGKGILAALWPGEAGSYVFKIGGPSSLLAREKPAVIQFLKTIDAHTEAHGTASAKSAPSAVDPREKKEVLPSGPRGNVPPGWKEQKPGPMLLAAYGVESTAGKGLVTVSMLPGEAGGFLANVNRWRGQIGLPPVAQAELAKEAQALDLKVGKAMLIDLRNNSRGQGISAAQVSIDGNSWFYKLTGPATMLDQEKETFQNYLKSLDHAR